MVGEAVPYVVAAYGVFIALVGVYVAVIVARLSRTARRLEDLDERRA